jgi:hypothetical protein
MEQTTATSGMRSRHRSEHEIFEAIEKYERAGNIRPKEFAKMHQISDATFYNWLRRYRSRDAAGQTPKGFMPVSVMIDEDGSLMEDGLFAEVRGIKIYRRVEASYLVKLLS